jgi:ribosomal protein L9
MAKKEKVILIENGELGKNFKVTEVRRGFITNYLLPMKKIMLYNKRSLL